MAAFNQFNYGQSSSPLGSVSSSLNIPSSGQEPAATPGVGTQENLSALAQMVENLSQQGQAPNLTTTSPTNSAGPRYSGSLMGNPLWQMFTQSYLPSGGNSPSMPVKTPYE